MTFPRYQHYKDSGVEWLGEVPAHWEEIPLKAIVTCNDDALDEKNAPDYELLYVDIGSVDPVNGITNMEPMSFSSAPSRARRRVRHGDIIVSTVRTYLRAIVRIVDPPDNLIVSTGFAVLRPKIKIVNKYLGYLLTANFFVDNIIAHSVGVSYPAINASDLVRTKVLLPPIEDQLHISSFLDYELGMIDALISEQDLLVSLSWEKRQALISYAVTNGLNQEVPMKDSGIEWLGEVPSHWKVLSIKRISKFITSGPRGWADKISDEGALFIQSGDLSETMEIDFATAKRVAIPAELHAEEQRTRLFAKDVVVCITGAKTGKIAVASEVAEPAYINQHLCLIRPRNFLNAMFLGLYLNSWYGQTYFNTVQYGLKGGLSLDSIKEACVPVPSSEEQLEIVSSIYLEMLKYDELIVEAQDAIALLKQRRAALISAAVTGKIDVRGLVAARKRDVALA